MFARNHRLVFGAAIWVTRIFGGVLVALAILGLPQMRPFTGRLAPSFELLTSAVLALAGVAWLIMVQLFLHFFDRYLSRN